MSNFHHARKKSPVGHSATGLLSRGCFLLLWLCASLLPGIAHAQNWQLVWSDEFNYTGYPDNKWRPEVWNPGVVNNELQHYTANADNAWVSNGTLKIKAAAVYNPATGQNDYYSARLNSTTAWTYGRFEARIKLPGGWGTWPAFWLYPTNEFMYGTNPITNYGWPNAGEIDIMEQVGYEQNVIHASTHSGCCFWAVGTQRTGTTTVADPTANWHVYAAEWYPDRIAFYVDNVNYFTVWNDGTGPNSWPFNHDFRIILNLAVGGTWGGAQGVDPNIWPRTLEVDYVRVYQQGAGGGTPIHIEAESYSVMSGVDVENCSEGGQNVGWIDAGDWMVWDVNVPTSGTYRVDYRVASQSGGGTIQFERAGGGLTYGTLSVPSTGGWQNWTTISHQVSLTAGQQQVAIYVPSGGYNLNWLRLTRIP
ncbi:carbohydrate-binding protein [Cellvibrio polysaccharolyticus]|uniref:Glycoside hydrolase family 16 n=1 Tax=Cellvibrio polysaccharolyticus TaxID=2082724 RepID=A0A928YT93_9GAMM|nr:carbohydrate-binding protein [Cellvibrio polysaccharolyticus]MBE8716070.1 glycoside hydrolase family 16 [Cellvibrio polysaccharolyticus]